MEVAKLKEKFKNEWVLAEVIKEDNLNRVLEVKPLVHSKNRTKVYEALSKVGKHKHVTTIYTGKIPPKGMVYSFHAHASL